MAVDFQHKLSSPHMTDPLPATAPPNVLLVNWRAVRKAGRACCCTARPMVVALMPPVPGRPHRTELLLCGHHFRGSKPALAAADAVVVDMNGVPLGDCDWPESGESAPLAGTDHR
jgi:hypothetical protein